MNTWRQVLQSLSLIAAALSLTACPSNHAKSGPTTSRYYVKGDPNLIIQGAKLNPTSPITEANILEWQKMKAVKAVFFEEQEERQNKDMSQIKNDQAASDGAQAEVSRIEVSKNADGTWKMKVLPSLSFLLSPTADGRLQPTAAIGAKGDSQPLQVKHWSVSEDGNLVSVLFDSLGSTEGRMLAAFYFEIPGSAVVPRVDTKYAYLSGPGMRVGWSVLINQAVELNLCAPAQYMPDIQRGLGVWTKYLQGRLNVHLSQASSYFPFSDLKQHCIYFVPTYRSYPQDDAMNYGGTVTTESTSRGKIYDSDVLMFLGEFEKLVALGRTQGYSDNFIAVLINGKAKMAVAHELGHFFGLDHKFDGTSSLMSYDGLVDEPTSYDVEALQALYPLL